MRVYNNEQSKLIGALVGLCRSLDDSNTTKEAYDTLVESIQYIRSEDNKAVIKQTEKVHEAKYTAVPDCSICSAPCGRTNDYCLEELDDLDGNLKNLKFEILEQLYHFSFYLNKKIAKTDYDQQIMMVLMKGLFAIGYDYFNEEELNEIIQSIKSSMENGD